MKCYYTLTFLFIVSIGLSGCSRSLEGNKSHQRSHTQKLQRPLSVSFLSSDKIMVSNNSSQPTSLKIYLKRGKLKKLLEESFNLSENTHKINLPEDLSDFTYIIAVVESKDSNGNIMSSADTYKIGEQELINKAKQELKDRN